MRGLGFVYSFLFKRKRRISRALVYITDWYSILVGLVGGIVSVIDGLDGYDVWLVISEGRVLLRIEILYNIDLFYNYVRYGFLEGGFGIWNIVV